MDSMFCVKVKALSVNQAWQGKRYKTPAYKAYEQELLLMLPPHFKVPDGPLSAFYTFGLSSPLSDWDNPIKPFQDVLQKKYNFDDRRITEAVVRKVLVKKGAEFIGFDIKTRLPGSQHITCQ